MRRTAAQRRRHRAVPHRDSARRHAAPDGRRAGDPYLRQGIAGQARKKGLAERHHALHPPRRGGVPLHPPRPQRQPGADRLAAQGQKTRRADRARNPDLPLRRRIRAVARGAETQTAHRPHVPLPHGPIRRYSAARRSASPTASTSGVSRSKPGDTGITTTSGCWP